MTDDSKDPPITDDDGWGDAADIDKPEPEPPKKESKPAPKSTRAPSPEPLPEPEPYIPPSPSPDLRSAAFDDDEPAPKRGLFSRKKRTDDKPSKRYRAQATTVSGKRALWVIGIGAFVLLFGVCAVLSWLNSSGFYFVCQPTQIIAERGRWLPWGHTTMTGLAWAPIDKPEDVRCKDRRFDQLAQLKSAYAGALKTRASDALAAATEKRISAEALELADKQLHQALLLLRDAETDDERKQLKRLQGDVEYWRAAAGVSSAIEQLTESGKRFDEAAARGPRHAGDSSTWADYAREISEELRQGPPKLRPEQPAPTGSTPPFSGTGTSPVVVPPDTDTSADAGPTPERAPDAGPPPTDAAPPPLPTGGVLL